MGQIGRGTFGDRVELSEAEREQLGRWQRSADVDALAARRARMLELLGSGKMQVDVEDATGAGIATVGRVRRRYLEEGLEAAVFGYKAKGAPRLLGPDEEAKIVALACTHPPEGRAKWTTALLAEHAVDRGLVDRVGRETVRLVLHHHGIKPWREKNVVRRCAG